MGGKSRKTGTPSKALIERLKQQSLTKKKAEGSGGGCKPAGPKVEDGLLGIDK